MTREPISVSEAVDVQAGEEPDQLLPPHAGPTVPSRPADSAAKARWLEYAAALGLDPSGPAADWTRAQIVAWCDRQG